MEQAWLAIERAIVAASLAEIDPGEAGDRMCAAVSEHLGAGCSLVEGHLAGGDTGELRLLLGSAADDSAATLVVSPSQPLERDVVERLEKLFGLLNAIRHPIPKGAKALHQLRNRLAGVQANIEFVEMVVNDVAAGPLPFAQRDDVVKALGHASTSCREMSSTLRSLSAR